MAHLPPVSLSFSLPPDYPSLSPPSVVISCPWLHTKHITKSVLVVVVVVLVC